MITFEASIEGLNAKPVPCYVRQCTRWLISFGQIMSKNAQNKRQVAKRIAERAMNLYFHKKGLTPQDIPTDMIATLENDAPSYAT